MTNVIADSQDIQNIAQSIAEKNRDYSPMTLAQMPDKVAGIPTFPTGGTTGQALVKASDADFDVTWGDVGSFSIDEIDALKSLADAEIERKERILSTKWADGSWTDIAELLAMHYANKIDIHDYWKVGDERIVPLTAMNATGVGESHVAQNVTLRLMSADHYNMVSGGKAAFVFQQVHLLANGTNSEPGYMESTNTNANGWHNSARHAWCNNVYKAALPTELQNLLKQVSIITATKGNARGTTTSSDYIFLPAEKEVFGTNTYADSTDETSLKQYDWYASHNTNADRIKKYGSDSGSASSWWERSPRGSSATNFCAVGNDGSAGSSGASSTRGLAPCGCI